ncbi:glycosyltransferase family 9 protein [Bdellovibrio sp. HCB337]|uniref:glycosyltransferase family 9 protein n=1 Tax=Bdellovibrio sp. HCB337 TaxID=3394358 RepID=UPI0039A44AAA
MAEKTNGAEARFLIIRFSSFGDVTQSLSIPSAIQKAYPNAKIEWITRKDMAPLLKHHPAIDRIWEYDRKSGLKGLWSLLSLMGQNHYTHIYDAHNNLRSRFVYWRLGLFRSTLFIRRSQKRWKRFLLFRLHKNTYEIPFSGQRDLLEPLTPWNISKALPQTPQIFIDEADLSKADTLLGTWKEKKYVALAPSAAYFLKRWPVSHFKQLIQLMPDVNFLLLGGPEDRFIEEIEKIAPDRILNTAGKAPLTVSAALVKKAQVLVSNDTGLLHVGEQLGKPTIALMGPAPFGFPSRTSTKIMELNLSCRPCSKHGQGPCVNKVYHQCLVDITPEQVAAEVRAKLGSLL